MPSLAEERSNIQKRDIPESKDFESSLALIPGHKNNMHVMLLRLSAAGSAASAALRLPCRKQDELYSHVADNASKRGFKPRSTLKAASGSMDGPGRPPFRVAPSGTVP